MVDNSYMYPVDERVIKAAISWMQENKGGKFFALCHVMSPHEGYPPKEENHLFLPDTDNAAIESVREKMCGRKDDSIQGWNDDELRILRGLYRSNLKHSDKWIGKLYDALKKMGLADNTLFIITSDHGEHLGEHGRLTHGSLPWDTVTHTPLIMVYPPLIQPGTTIGGLTESVDIVPTILEICRITLPNGKAMDGKSLVRYIGKQQTGKDAVFTKDSIRTSRYKYIRRRNLLYDLRRDPNENENIARKNPKIAQEMKNAFEQYIKPYRDRFNSARSEEPPPYEFHYPINYFEISPGDSYETWYSRKNLRDIVKNSQSKKPWLFNKKLRNYALYRLSKNNPSAPITLRTKVPNGTYGISLLLETSKPIPQNIKSFGFRYRFDTREPFQLPEKINLLRNDGSVFYYNFDLSSTSISDQLFSLTISFDPPDENIYTVYYIAFSPAQGTISSDIKRDDNETFRKNTESLHSLGYL